VGVTYQQLIFGPGTSWWRALIS